MTKATPPPHSRRKVWLFRFLAVLLSLSPLVGLELLCRAFGWGKPTDYNDPFVGFSEVHPLFVLDEEEEEYRIPRSRYSHFLPESFPAIKGPKERRLFVLGGSTVQGRPYGHETAFTTFLEIGLNAADSECQWDVINCGGVSYASYRLTPILREVLNYQPDLIILCTGHNEFLEDRSYDHIKHAPEALAWSQRQASKLRTFNLFRGAWLDLTGQSPEVDLEQRPELGPEADARLDWKGGLEKYHRDEEWRRRVMAHFETGVAGMVRTAQKAGVPILLVVPVSCLEWPPFKSEHRAGLSEAERERFEELREKGRSLLGTDSHAALELFEEARKIDDRYAQLHYDIGLTHRSRRNYREAKAALLRAKEEDICPLRMLEPMRQAMLRVGTETETPLLDAHAFFEERSRGGIPDREWLIDHVHPGIEGHQELGFTIAEMVIEPRMQPKEGWKAEAREAARAAIENLSPDYFALGQQRLKAVQQWARGQADRVKGED